MIKKIFDGDEFKKESIPEGKRPDFFDLTPTTYKNRRDSDEEFITSKVLIAVGERLKTAGYSRNSRPLKELHKAAGLLLTEENKTFQEEQKSKQERADALMRFIHASSVFINIAFDDGSNTSQHIDINKVITQLLRENTGVKKLDITVPTMQLEKTIAIIETWAYSKEGNLKNRLNVNVYVDDDPLPVTFIAGKLKDRFTVVIADVEGFLDMTEVLGEMLQQYSQQMCQYLAWSLPKSPEVRAFKRMHYDYGATLFSTNEEKLSDATFASLLHLVTDAYENNTTVEEGNVLALFGF